jgi:hypothetical protein
VPNGWHRKWFKGRAALAVDSWYSTGDVGANLEEARDYLQSDQSFEAIVEALNATDRGRPEFVYPYEHSYLQGPEFESVMRQGYLEAIALAFRHSPPVPVETFWMTGAGNDAFEMHISDGVECVSATLLVPVVDGGSYDPGSPEGWGVRIDGEGQTETIQTSGPPNPVPPSMRDTDTV